MKGAMLLKEWLETHGSTAPRVAALVGVSGSAMYAYLTEIYRPGRKAAVAIERLTEGAVPVASWEEEV